MPFTHSQKRSLFALTLGFFGVISLFSQEIQVPPTPPAPVFNNTAAHVTAAAPIAGSPVQFSVGDPTDEEQMYLELINRARKDANAEALRLIALPDANVQFALRLVDTNLMKSQFAIWPPAPPLSFNAKLITAARGHTQYQFDTVQQTHFEGSVDLAQRLHNAGYNFFTGRENVFSYAYNVDYGHAGFEIDWSGGTANGGMQTPPGHRENIHTNVVTEIGIGVILGSNTNYVTNADNTITTNKVGPMLVTQDMAAPLTPVTYITGVAYYDVNGNNFYDIGEGLGGITVTVDGVDAYAITTASGAYSIPVPPNTTLNVHFQGPNISPTTTSVTLDGSKNFKLDFKPTVLQETTTTSPSVVYVGAANLFTLTPAPAATGYRARAQQLHATAVEGAENGTNDVIVSIFGNYPVISTTVRATATASFHVGHQAGISAPGTQIIQLKHRYYPNAGSQLHFNSRLGFSTAAQVAHVEVSTDDGLTWTEIYSQAGSDSLEQNFSAKSVTLAAYAGRLINIRFTYTVNGNYYPLPDPSDPNFDIIGWFIDDILIDGSEATDPVDTEVAADGAFHFTPGAAGDYLLQFQAENGLHHFAWGPLKTVTAQALTPPTLAFLNNVSIAAGAVTLKFDVQSGVATTFALDSASSISGPWTNESAAQFSGPVNGHYTVTAPVNGGARFYRVRPN